MLHIDRMMSAVMLLAATLATAAPALAQHEHNAPTPLPRTSTAVDITGTVICVDGPALPGAVLQLFQTKDGKERLQTSALSDAGGRFRLSAPSGAYTLRIGYLGHANSERTIEIAPHARLQNLGVLRLEIAAVEMEAIVAAAEKDRVLLQSGHTVFDAKRNGTSAGGTVADVLRTVPNLEIDNDGRISVRGSSSVLVLINGRRTVLEGDALTAFLAQMPASALEKVEVSTSASAKQDAEGLAGVVNLEFETGGNAARNTGYALAGSLATAGQAMASASTNGSRGRLSWDAAYAFSSMAPHTYSHTMRDNLRAPAALRTSHQASHADAQHKLHNILATATARLSDSHQLTGRFGYSWMRGAFDNNTDFADIAASGSLTGSSFTSSTLEHTIPTVDASLTWSHRGNGRRHLRWTMDLGYAGGTERFNGVYAHPGVGPFLSTEMDFDRRDVVIQNDVAFDIRTTRVEAGHKVQLRSLDGLFVAQRGDVEANTFDLQEHVTALYGSLSRVAGDVFVQAGVRAEASGTRLTFSGAQDTERDDLRLFPSVAVHWPHAAEAPTHYQLSYGRRIQRPDATSLNPYSMGEDDMNSFIGNPALEAEVTDQVELAVTRRMGALNVQATPYLRSTAQPIRPLKAITATGYATTTLQNLERSRAAGLDLGVRARWNAGVSGGLGTNLFYGETQGEGVRSHGWYFNLRASLDIEVAPHMSLQLSGYRRSAQPIEQGEILPVVNSQVALTRRLGANRGLVTLRLSDPFDTNRLAFRIGDRTFSQDSERKVTSRMVTLFLSWGMGGEVRHEEQEPHEQPAPRIF